MGVLLLSEIAAESIRKSIGDRAEFVSLVLNGNNAIVDGKRVEIDWKDFGTGKVYQYSTVSLEPGRYDCRAIIRNLDDGRAAVGSCSIDVASPQTGGPALFPPFFLVRGPEARYLNLSLIHI